MKNYTLQDLPQEMRGVVLELNKSKDKEECLKKAYDIVTSRWRGYRWATVTHFWNLFNYNPKSLWNKKVLICTNLNHILRVLLISSNFFEKKDIKIKWSLIWFFSPHQYLQIKTSNPDYINVDPWGKAYGVKFGKYSHKFQ